ncbi:MAG: putative lipid II flippase FtsW [Armatimonadota bacterium]|nr:putative lipid II flippase FtsW [Armatimonadota bacterium]
MRESKKLPADFTLFLTTMCLFGIGILMVFDASFAKAADMKMTGGDSWYFVKRQLIFGVAGLAMMFGMMRLRLETLRRMALPLLIASIGLLVLVLIPGIGVRANGAARWLPVGPFRFQPSEFAKFAVVIYLAAALSGQNFRVRKFWSGMFIHLTIVGLVAGLVLVEPDMGTSSLIVINTLIMLFVAGALSRHLACLAGAGVLGFGALAVVEPYRLARLITFLDPMKDKFGKGYQIVHSLVALGSGGLLGRGLCEGREKFYIPAAQTDFIFSTLGEEAGLLGSLVVLALFGLLTYRGLSIANRAKSPYYTLLAAGLTAMVSAQAIINVCVVTSSMPATGVPLPFVSYGGSALMFALMAAGLLLNISQNTNATTDRSVEEIDEGRADRRRDRRSHIPRPQHSGRDAGRRSRSRSTIYR